MQFLVTTTTTTHVLLPKGRHTAARQRVKAARQLSGWSPAARLSRSPRSLPSPCHPTWPNTTPAGLPATRYSHFPRLSPTPSCEVLGFSSPPCIAWKVSILYPKKDVPRPHGDPQAGHLRRPILQFNSPKQVQARLPDQCWAIPPVEHWHSPVLGLVAR